MAAKPRSERTRDRRERGEKIGMLRLDSSVPETTCDMLRELVEKAGYDENKRERSKGVSGVLTQLIYEVYHRTDKVKLNRKKQQGFILAQKLKKLKTTHLDTAKKYVEKEKPSE